MLVMLLPACNASEKAVGACKVEFEVSLVALLANPEKFDEKCVQTSGKFLAEFESSALFLHYEDYQNVDYANAIRLIMTEEDIKKYENYNGETLILSGYFYSGNFEDLYNQSYLKLEHIQATF